MTLPANNCPDIILYMNEFTILFWNIWLENQVSTALTKRFKLLNEEIARFIETYQPDFFAANEVIKACSDKNSRIYNDLASLGFNHEIFAKASNWTLNEDIGAALFSKTSADSHKIFTLGADTPAKKRGFDNQTLDGIAASFNDISLLIVHPMHLRPWTIRGHYGHTKNIKLFIDQPKYKHNCFIVGDFNEMNGFPHSFHAQTRRYLNYRSGSFTNPTWQHITSKGRKSPLKYNLDKLFWTKDNDYELTDFQILSSGISDHKPLLIRFKHK